MDIRIHVFKFYMQMTNSDVSNTCFVDIEIPVNDGEFLSSVTML